MGNRGNENSKRGMDGIDTYVRLRLDIADLLRIARQCLKTLEREEAERQCAELMVKLAEDRFVLATLGLFKRGKSSLMNAILGRDLLPSGILPLTSVITRIRYGDSERILVYREGDSFPSERQVSELANFVTEKGNPDNREKVEKIFVELPDPFLRKGIEFVDTPGIGSSIIANTVTTYDFLPECDAVLFITGADAPLSHAEILFLKEIRRYVHKIFFVVNKIDLVSKSEKEEVLRFINGSFSSLTGMEEMDLFAISSKIGLEAKKSGSKSMYIQSGCKTLEDGLSSFLSREKTITFLSAIIYRALNILRVQDEQGAFEESTVSERLKTVQKEKGVGILQDPHEAVQKIMKVRTRLERLYQNIAGSVPPITGDLDIDLSEDSDKVEEYPITASLHEKDVREEEQITAEEIVPFFKTKSCPVCQYLIHRSWEFYTHWQYALSNEEKIQHEFAKDLGFCPLHTWQLLAISSPYGASVGYASLSEQMAVRLKEIQLSGMTNKSIKDLLRHPENCRVCILLREAERQATHQLARMMERDGMDLYLRSQGVCLHHLDLLLGLLSSVKQRDLLLSYHVRLFQRDAEDMRSYALKRDALKRDLLHADEKNAYRKAIIRIVGSRNMIMPWQEEGEI